MNWVTPMPLAQAAIFLANHLRLFQIQTPGHLCPFLQRQARRPHKFFLDQSQAQIHSLCLWSRLDQGSTRLPKSIGRRRIATRSHQFHPHGWMDSPIAPPEDLPSLQYSRQSLATGLNPCLQFLAEVSIPLRSLYRYRPWRAQDWDAICPW